MNLHLQANGVPRSCRQEGGWESFSWSSVASRVGDPCRLVQSPQKADHYVEDELPQPPKEP